MEDTREFKFKYPLHHYTANMVYLRLPLYSGGTYQIMAENWNGTPELVASYTDEREANAASLRARDLVIAARALAGETA